MIQRGQRDKLDKYLNTADEFSVEMSVSGGDTYDYCCFGVDAEDKLSDDRYMVFYNQPRSPQGEITWSAKPGGAAFAVNLGKLPAAVNKLVFTVSIDGCGNMGSISSHSLKFTQNGQAAAEMVLSGSDFNSEKAIISVEIYKKEDWRFSAVARGFNGGLGDLLKSYGGEIAEESPAPETIQSPFAPRDIPRSGGSEDPTGFGRQAQQPFTPPPVQQPSPQPIQQPSPQPIQQPADGGFIPTANFGDVGSEPKSTVTQRPGNMPQPVFGHPEQ